MHEGSQAIDLALFTSVCVQIVVKEDARQWYHFLTTLCAIIGGVFTVAGLLDSMFYSVAKMAKKVELGKQG